MVLPVGLLERVLETGCALLSDCRVSPHWKGNGWEGLDRLGRLNSSRGALGAS